MNDITVLALLVSKAKASAFTMEYISQFEASDIDSDDVDLRFEVDGVETGTNVSIVDECSQAAQVITALVEALEAAGKRAADMEVACELYAESKLKQIKLEAANAELVEALEKAQRANAAQDDHINQQQDRIDQLEKGHQEAAKQINSWRRLAKQNIDEREKDISELEAARQRITELEKSHAQVIQSRDHYKRMTEEGLKQLAESRTVTLPKRYSCEGYHIDEAYLQEDPEGDCYDRDEVLEALAAAGIQVIEGEQKNG